MSGNPDDGISDAMPGGAWGTLPEGVELYHLRPDGSIELADRDGARLLGPEREFLRFIDDGKFAHYLVGDATTSPSIPRTPRSSSVSWGRAAPSPRMPTVVNTSSSAWATRRAASTTRTATGSPTYP